MVSVSWMRSHYELALNTSPPPPSTQSLIMIATYEGNIRSVKDLRSVLEENFKAQQMKAFSSFLSFLKAQ